MREESESSVPEESGQVATHNDASIDNAVLTSEPMPVSNATAVPQQVEGSTPLSESHLFDDRILMYDSPTMISDLETLLQCIIRPEFHLLEILCHVHGFVEDTAYLYVDFDKLFAAAMLAETASMANKCMVVTNFLLPRLALKSDEKDINRWKLVLFLQPFQKHGFNGEFSAEVSSSKFKEPPLYQQILPDVIPEMLDPTPWPTVFDSSKLLAGEHYLNQYQHAMENHEAQSRRNSVRSSLFAKAWLGPNNTNNIPVTSTRPSVFVDPNNVESAQSPNSQIQANSNNIISPDANSGNNTNNSLRDESAITSSPKVTFVSTAPTASATNNVSLPKISKNLVADKAAAPSNGDENHIFVLASPTAAAHTAAVSLFPNLSQQSQQRQPPPPIQSPLQSPLGTANGTNSNFLPKLGVPSGDSHSSHSRRESFTKEPTAGGKHVYDFLIGEPTSINSSRVAEADAEILSSSESAPEKEKDKETSKRSTHGNNSSHLQRRSLGNANFVNGKSSGGNNVAKVISEPTSTSSSRMLRRSFGMDPIQSKALENSSSLPKLNPLSSVLSPTNNSSIAAQDSNNHNNNTNNNNSNNNHNNNHSDSLLASSLYN